MSVYLDNAATKVPAPEVVKAVEECFKEFNANPLRGMYETSLRATAAVVEARETVAKFIGAQPDEIVFTRGATEGLNMAAMMLARLFGADTTVCVGEAEHHSNILPWVKNFKKVDFELGQAAEHKIVALSTMSNVTGAICEVPETDGIIVVDAAQYVAHRAIDVKKLGADILAFSGHKIGAPMGVGVLYIKRDLMNKLAPVYYGGEMVNGVEMVNGEIAMNLAAGPQKFEAGTLNLPGIVGLAAAIKLIEARGGIEKLNQRVVELTEFAKNKMAKLDCKIYAAENGIITFNMNGVHAHDTAEICARNDACVRAGYHCAEPYLKSLGWGACVRVSLSADNTESDVEKLVEVLATVPEAIKQEMLERGNYPEYKGELDEWDLCRNLVNESCGDEITVQVKVSDGVIVDAKWSGHGCAISQASADYMCERLVGLSLKQALEVRKKFEQLVVSGKEDDALLKLNRLAEVSRMPARANCAKLAWKTLD